jgi:hemerythrin superfamily protein
MAKSKNQPAANSGKGTDAIALLMADHKKVKGLFEEFKRLKEADGSDEEKAQIVGQICSELRMHTEIEEEIFYPAVREAIEDTDLMDEALVEHAGAKDLIEQLEGVDPDDDLYDAKVTVLGEQIDHHVKEEEGEMFPKAKKASIDTADLAAQMAQRKEELMTEADSASDEELDEDEEDDDSGPVKKKAANTRREGPGPQRAG